MLDGGLKGSSSTPGTSLRRTTSRKRRSARLRTARLRARALRAQLWQLPRLERHRRSSPFIEADVRPEKRSARRSRQRAPRLMHERRYCGLAQAVSYCDTDAVLREFCGCEPAYLSPRFRRTPNGRYPRPDPGPTRLRWRSGPRTTGSAGRSRAAASSCDCTRRRSRSAKPGSPGRCGSWSSS